MNTRRSLMVMAGAAVAGLLVGATAEAAPAPWFRFKFEKDGPTYTSTDPAVWSRLAKADVIVMVERPGRQTATEWEAARAWWASLRA